jgi:putative transposase
MKTFKVEEVRLTGYETFADVATRPPRFTEEACNTKRLHSALGYRSPDLSPDMARNAWVTLAD